MIKQLLNKIFPKRCPSEKLFVSDLSSYSHSMEKYKRRNDVFELPFAQKRYDEIINALKYTKHNKRRAELLKTKQMYDEILANRSEV